MTEFELKLEIPAGKLPAVVAAMRAGKARHQRLQALYFDTEDGALARHGIVVRARKEGRKWVQTAKAPGGAVLERLEHTRALPAPGAGAAPAVDLSRHAGTPVGEAIEAALKLDAAGVWPSLVALYETDVQRLAQAVQVGASTMEIALDQGHVRSGAQSAPVCELEIELKEGSAADAVLLARHWCAQYGLWLNTVSKSTKGQRLAAGKARGPAVPAQAPEFARKAGAKRVAAAIIGACLDQVLGNASEVAAGSDDTDPIHQLRVGIRRLRTALREIGALVDGVDPAWERPLVDAFRALGQNRDYSHLERSMQPQMAAAGGPAVSAGQAATDIPDAAATVRGAAFQDVLLCLVGWTQELAADAGSAADNGPRKIIRKRLATLHNQVAKDGRRFMALQETGQHRVRKRLKRLRYLSEFAAPLFSRRKTGAFIEALKPAQDALGLYNDELTALHSYQAFSATEPKAWFGVGWLSARRAPNAAACMQALKAFAKARPFWD